jgi:SAM-dependent methyltransferase
MSVEVADAYERRAAEYTALFGTMTSVHPSDRQLVATWADGIQGPVIDAGCGPGQWTGFLAEHGLAVRGVDLVPSFVDHARSALPGLSFTVGSLDALEDRPGSVGGVLSWYSLIHREPRDIGVPLREFHRVLRPGGGVLIGFFEGTAVEQFAHAVIPAYRWPVSALSEELEAAGFEVVESHVRKTAGERPQAAISARRRAG